MMDRFICTTETPYGPGIARPFTDLHRLLFGMLNVPFTAPDLYATCLRFGMSTAEAEKVVDEWLANAR
jgi:hypothetical protein